MPNSKNGSLQNLFSKLVRKFACPSADKELNDRQLYEKICNFNF